LYRPELIDFKSQTTFSGPRLLTGFHFSFYNFIFHQFSFLVPLAFISLSPLPTRFAFWPYRFSVYFAFLQWHQREFKIGDEAPKGVRCEEGVFPSPPGTPPCPPEEEHEEGAHFFCFVISKW